MTVFLQNISCVNKLILFLEVTPLDNILPYKTFKDRQYQTRTADWVPTVIQKIPSDTGESRSSWKR